MKKQIVSFLMAAFLFAPCLRSLKFEVTDKEFTFILDDKDNSAILKDIYIPLKTKKKLEIPRTVDWCDQTFIVRGIMEYGIRKVIHRIMSITFPNTLYETEETRKAYNWFLLFDIPVYVNNTPFFIGPTLFKFERR
jgi:hypothetical protein